MLPAGFLADLQARVDIKDVVGRHVDLKKAGINWKGLCPFHGEKTPSFIVSPSRQTYHCFGCGAHGDAIRFLTDHLGLHFMEAVKDLAAQVGVQVPEDRRDPAERAREQAQQQRRQTLGQVLERASAHYREQLRGSDVAIAYLKRRGLTGTIARDFGLGYAPAGRHSLAAAFAHYDDPLLVEAGLVIQQEEGEDGKPGRRYDRFRDRIMFPIRSTRGEVIGFGARVLDGGGEPKYLNSPETPVFQKGRELYGLHEARTAIRKRGHALVVEGYMDVVALAQSGLGHAVATLGTACTPDHVAKLLRFTDSVVFSFDGDAAGRRAAARALEAALPHATDTRSFRFLFLPAEHDPDSYVRAQGRAAFEAMEDAAVPLSQQLLVQAGDGLDLGSAEGRARMLATARPWLATMPDGLLREQVLASLARQAGLDGAQLAARWAGDAATGTASEAGAGAARADRGQSPERPRSGAPARAPATASWSRPGRATPQAATRLDRAAWLAARRAEQWDRLTEAQRTLLCEQPHPYGSFFSALDRQLADDGPLPLPVLLTTLAGQLRGADGSPGHAGQDGVALDDDDPATRALLARIAGFDRLDPEPPARDLAAVLRGLELLEVRDQLDLLTQSLEITPTMLERVRALNDRARQLREDSAAESAD